MLSLAYRIVAMERVFPATDITASNHETIAHRLAGVADSIQHVPKIKLDNVSKFYADHPQSLWDIQDDIPNWAPPFNLFWAEWQCFKPTGGTSHVHENDFLTRNPNSFAQTGCFVMAMECHKGKLKNDNDITMAIELMGMFAGYRSGAFSDNTIDRIKRNIGVSKWVVMVMPWSTIGTPPISGRPFYDGSTAFVFVSEHGRSVDSFVVGAYVEIQDWSWSILHVLGLGISFMHCKNVRQIDAKDESGSQRFREQYKIPKFRYRTLCIDPMKEVLRLEGNSETEGLKRALHICRGHFSTYSEEKPLFGKYPGTFWIPDHVRGKKEHGEVQKDYDVKPAS